MKFSFNARKFKYGTAGTMFVALFIAVLIVVNILAQFLTDRFSLKLDMTESGQYSLTSETKELLSSLESDVNIYILSKRADFEKNDVLKGILETVQRYNSASNGRVKYEFIDPQNNPAFFAKHEKAKNSGSNPIVVESDKRYIVLKGGEFAYQYQNDKSGKVYHSTEQEISGAILYVTSKEVTGAGFVTGHGEIEPDALKDTFSGNNYEVSTVDLLSEVPDSITNLVISSPSADFTAQEIENLDKYMKRFGNTLYVFWGADVPSCPVLERYLAEWGIKFESYIVCDGTQAYLSESNIVPDVVNGDVVNKDEKEQLMVISPATRPVTPLFTEKDYMRTITLLNSSKSSYGKLLSADKKISTLAKESGDAQGPFTVGMVTEKLDGTLLSSGSPVEDKVTRVFAFGSYALAANDVVGVSRSFNSRLLAQIVSYANPNTLTMNIEPKTEIKYDLNITEGGARVLFAVLVVIIPLLILAAGIAVFIIRKNK